MRSAGSRSLEIQRRIVRAESPVYVAASATVAHRGGPVSVSVT